MNFTNKFSWLNDAEKEIISRFRSIMLIFSILITIVELLNILDAFYGEIKLYIVLIGITRTIIDVAFYLPTQNFANITKTSEHNIETVMRGFKVLRGGWIIVIII